MTDVFTPKPVSYWLAACAALVFIMVAVGGLTRLTESGLSIVEWKPVSGALPPLTAENWQEEFVAYQSSPQFKIINHRMTLEEFKKIFWLEYIHRLLGRIIGLSFIFPLLFFYVKRHISGRYALKMLGIFALGGAQGAIGWYMVKSGLVRDPMVSPYRLALHLGVGVALFALLCWEWLSLRTEGVAQHHEKNNLARWAWGITAVTFIQILLGALVAGNDAGLAYNTFPLMNGAFAPDGMLAMTPRWRNFFENVATVQFMHRMGAYFLAIIIPLFWIIARKRVTNSPAARRIDALPVLLALQIALGVMTLLHQVPVILAALHQAVALLLLGTSLAVVHDLKQKEKTT